MKKCWFSSAFKRVQACSHGDVEAAGPKESKRKREKVKEESVC